MSSRAARPADVVTKVGLRACDVIGGVVVGLVWDVVDPAARIVDGARRALGTHIDLEHRGPRPSGPRP